MTDRPILFSAPMIRALIDGRKTKTRRAMPNQEWLQQAYAPIVSGSRIYNYAGEEELSRARFSRGDRLWVREAWNAFSFSQDGDEAWPTKVIPTAEEMRKIIEAAYRVDIQAVYRESDRAREWFSDKPWRPGIHMPRWASRLTLIVTDVRVERLQEISEEDAIAEGCAWSDCHEGYTPCPEPGDGRFYHGRWAARSFQFLWESINGDDAWEANPWIAAYTFTVHRANIDALGKDAA